MSRTREMHLDARMSEHEALMWHVEKDPWLNPSGGSVVLLDGPVDMDRFRRMMRFGVANTPRLYQRVVPGFGRLSTPAWVPDPEFDLDAHLRHITLPAPGTERQLLDLAARLYCEPLDRTRPLWRFVVIDGVEGGRSALWVLTHHSVADGIGQLRMAEMYQQMEPDAPPHPDVDLEGIVAAAVAEHDALESGGNLATSAVSTITDSAAHVVRRQIGIARRMLGEVALWPADPGRISETVSTATETVTSTVGQLRSSTGESAGGSPLWAERSRHRRLDWVRFGLDDVLAVARAADAKVNDVFMAVLAEAAHRYHDARGVAIDTVNSSFVLSTRSDGKAGGNAFTPVPVRLPAGPMTPLDRVREVAAIVGEAKESAGRTGGITALSGVVNLLPTSVITRTARAAAAHIDFATSNLRGAPFPLYVAGTRVIANVPLGPVAGTGANVTAISYDGWFDIGIASDPAAIDDPDDFRTLIERSFADLVKTL